MNSIILMNSLKNIALSSVMFVVLFFLPTALFADSISIGVVNISKLMKEAPQAEEFSRKLNAKFHPIQEKLEKQQVEIKELERRKNEDDISPREKNLRERDLLKRKREYRRKQEDLREDWRFARGLALDKVQNEVYEAIHIVREKLGIDIIIQEYISANKRVDITNNVLEYLREKIRQKQSNRNSNRLEKNNDSHFISQ
ncbi:MAG TPA: OmpH family outer membrane protein [Gammaproteobacteria bacterium]|nr:OmpH family outer membrane protein [Gammaproteobacteria bacterium]